MHILPPLPEKKEYLPYAWLPVSKKPESFEEIMICDHQVKYSHVRVYEAKPGTDLAEVVALESLMDDDYVKMLLVINHKNAYTIPNLPNEKWAWPVAIITADSGIRLKHILHQHPEGTKMNLMDSPQDTNSKPTQLSKGIPSKVIFS